MALIVTRISIRAATPNQADYRELNEPLPQPEWAMDIVQSLVGVAPAGVRLFGKDTEHFVFEVTFSVRRPLVVRMTTPEKRRRLVDGVRLSRQLRPMGVPLPSIIAVMVDAAFPYLVLERLPGVDIGMAMRCLSDDALAMMAKRVAAAQAIVSTTPQGEGYGVAAEPDQAPHASWSGVISAMLDHIRWQDARGGNTHTDLVDQVDWIALAARGALDLQPPTPFLHDATTRNVIVTLEGRFSGIVGVDDLCFGDPRFAAGRTQASILLTQSAQPPSRYVQHLLAAAGAAEDRVFRLYVALFLLEFLVIGPLPDSEERRARLYEMVAGRIAALAVEWGVA